MLALKAQLEKTCTSVGEFIKNEFGQVSRTEIGTKDRNSLVSYVDTEAEKMLVSALSNILPNAGFITEENTVASESRNLMWVIDPLDGTTNFLYSIPHFSISIALLENKDVILGVVYDVMQSRCFSAVKSLGAWENSKPIRVSPRIKKSEALVVTGFPYERELMLKERLAVLHHIIKNYRGLRRLGSAALDLAYVASGRFDIYYENTLNIWDIAAGALLVEEAGGKLTDFSGLPHYLKNGEVIACAPPFYDEIYAVVNTHLS